MSKDRTETFSDAVFAIILTLLVLELHVPAIPDGSSMQVYGAAMAPLLPKVAIFALTFVMICVHWVSHHYFFRQLDRVSIGFVWVNNLFLLWLCFLPFPTALLGDHPLDQFPILLYGVDSLLGAATFLAFRGYASRARLFKEEMSAVLHGPRRSLPAVSLFTLSIIVSFVNPYLALACFFAVPLMYFIPSVFRVPFGAQRSSP